jgi:uncharacterized peroxidase-related enzyme
MPTTSDFPVHTAATAPPASRAALVATEKSLGFLPNLFATMSGSPEALTGYLTLEAVLAKGSFTAAERQLVLIAASAANGCAYCVAAHSGAAASLQATPAAIAAARGGSRSSDVRTDALIAFTHAVTHRRGHVDSGELARFTGVGFTGAQAMEVAANVALKTISNYIDGLAHVALDEPLKPQRWQAADGPPFVGAA